MRAKVLVLIALLIVTVFFCGCAVDMSSKDQKADKGVKLCKMAPIVEGLGVCGGDNSKVLVRNNSGKLYIVDINRGLARVVGGFDPN